MSCSTNPLATFKLLGQGMDVRLSHPGDIREMGPSRRRTISIKKKTTKYGGIDDPVVEKKRKCETRMAFTSNQACEQRRSENTEWHQDARSERMTNSSTEAAG
jgi:hypothetical protein